MIEPVFEQYAKYIINDGSKALAAHRVPNLLADLIAQIRPPKPHQVDAAKAHTDSPKKSAAEERDVVSQPVEQHAVIGHALASSIHFPVIAVDEPLRT